MHYDWPGIIRELEHCIARAVALAEGPVIYPTPLPFRERGRETYRALKQQVLNALELEYLGLALREGGGNVRAAARVMGLHPRTLYKMLKRHGVKVADDME